MNKKVMVGIAGCALALGITGVSSANYVNGDLSVPGNNSSAYGMDQGVGYNTKDTNESNATFYTLSRSSYSGMDARIINSNKSSRSNWARNMTVGKRILASTTAVKGYKYNVEVSSDWTQAGTDTIGLRYSPDTE